MAFISTWDVNSDNLKVSLPFIPAMQFVSGMGIAPDTTIYPGVYDILIDWGDGDTTRHIPVDTESMRNMSHTYDEPGEKTITITVATGQPGSKSGPCSPISAINTELNGIIQISAFDFDANTTLSNDLNTFNFLISSSTQEILLTNTSPGILSSTEVSGISGSYTNTTAPLYINFGDGSYFNTPEESVFFYTSYEFVTTTGIFQGWNFRNAILGEDMPESRKQIKSIDDWGDLDIYDAPYAFADCINLESVPNDSTFLGQVTSLESFFEGCTSLDCQLGNWDVGNIVDMSRMFFNCLSYNNGANNTPINSWDVSNVKYMNGMFAFANQFNRSINGWHMENVETITEMFFRATAFNQACTWSINNLNDASGFMSDVTLGVANYNNLLKSWVNSTTIQSNVTADFGKSQYSGTDNDVVTAREFLLNNKSWVIFDWGMSYTPPPPETDDLIQWLCTTNAACPTNTNGSDEYDTVDPRDHVDWHGQWLTTVLDDGNYARPNSPEFNTGDPVTSPYQPRENTDSDPDQNRVETLDNPISNVIYAQNLTTVRDNVSAWQDVAVIPRFNWSLDWGRVTDTSIIEYGHMNELTTAVSDICARLICTQYETTPTCLSYEDRCITNHGGHWTSHCPSHNGPYYGTVCSTSHGRN